MKNTTSWTEDEKSTSKNSKGMVIKWLTTTEPPHPKKQNSRKGYVDDPSYGGSKIDHSPEIMNGRLTLT